MAWLAQGASSGLSFLGGLFGNAQARREAKKNREFQERMFRNRYQYTSDDLELAGLNRKLAVTGALNVGGLPSGSMAAQGNPAAAVGSAMTGAAAATKAGAEAKQSRARAGREGAETRKIDEMLDLQKELLSTQQFREMREALRTSAEEHLVRARETGQNFQNRLLELSIPRAESLNAFDASDLGQDMIKLDRLLETIDRMPSLGDILMPSPDRRPGGQPNRGQRSGTFQNPKGGLKGIGRNKRRGKKR